MKHQKPLALRIFIRICVVFMVISLIGVYVVYMFTPSQEAGENSQGGDVNIEAVEDLDGSDETSEESIVGNEEGETGGVSEESQIILPEINPDEPEDTVAPILITEDGEINEMDLTREVQLENGEIEIIRQGDLGDAIQIAQ